MRTSSQRYNKEKIKSQYKYSCILAKNLTMLKTLIEIINHKN